ncbi:MAG: sigma-70 family RNA polymerase sigma factor [Bacteriovoracaceae bacterium]|nr:sigma-70 family RNA polymerase sigma factor [Bacteriovoracaceae bacterium]
MNPYNGLEDDKLMVLYQKGSSQAFEILHERHKSRVITYLSKRIADKNAQNEIFQNIFLKLHRKRDLYNPDFLFAKWLYTICRSELVDYFRLKKMETVQWDEHLHASEQVPTKELIELEDFKTLTSDEKKAISLRYYSDQDFSEISETLGTSAANSRKIVSRGIAKLRAALAGEKK